MACRICLEESGELISPCACKGTAGYVHVECPSNGCTRMERTARNARSVNRNSPPRKPVHMNPTNVVHNACIGR